MTTKARYLADLLDGNGQLDGDDIGGGSLTTDVVGNVTGDLTGDVTGNLTGDVTGNLTGDVNNLKLNSVDNLPNVRPSLLLDFANSKTLDPRIDFTRSSTATYWDGKTTAKAEENLHTNSEALASWSRTPNVSTVADATTAPDGTTTAVKVYLSSGTNRCILYQGTNTIGKTYTYSIYAKAGEKTGAIFQAGVSGNVTVARWDLSSGTNTYVASGTSQTITSVGNGWYRLTVSRVADGTYTPWGISDDGTTQTLTANGTDGGYLWGPQDEERDSATAYTPTTGTPITRYQPVLQTALDNQPRFDHDPVTGESKGLLIEEQRTNYVTDSGIAPFNWSNVYGQPTESVTVAPDGSLDAKCFRGPRNNASSRFEGTYAFASGTTICLSWYEKSITGSFDVSTSSAINPVGWVGTVDGGVPIVGVEDVGNGWYRKHCVTTTNATSQILRMYFSSGLTTEDDCAVWGLQLETGSFPTSYIPTSGSQVTRAYDAAMLEDDNFYSWFNDEQGTVFMEGHGYNRGYSISDKGSSDRYFSNFYQSRHIYILSLNTLTWNSNDQTDSVNVDKKYAFAYGLEDQAVTDSGLSVLTRTGSSARYPYGLKRLSLGSGYNAAHAHLNGHIKKFAYYPARLPNATLQAMTEE